MPLPFVYLASGTFYRTLLFSTFPSPFELPAVFGENGHLPLAGKTQGDGAPRQWSISFFFRRTVSPRMFFSPVPVTSFRVVGRYVRGAAFFQDPRAELSYLRLIARLERPSTDLAPSGDSIVFHVPFLFNVKLFPFFSSYRVWYSRIFFYLSA